MRNAGEAAALLVLFALLLGLAIGYTIGQYA